MKSKMIMVFIAIMGLATFNASAQKRNLKDENQRIRQGVRSGELTALEAAKLQAEKKALKRQAARYKENDGVVSARERAELRKKNRRLSKNIRRQKHDQQKRH
jgi:hypothetical protein